MSEPLPLSQPPIYVTWHCPEGGIGVTARTDDKGQPYIGHYTLARDGLPYGRPSEYQRERLSVRVVAGYRCGEAVIVFADIEITKEGLSLRVNLPPSMAPTPRYLTAKWGSKLPPCWMELQPIKQWLADLRIVYSLNEIPD